MLFFVQVFPTLIEHVEHDIDRTALNKGVQHLNSSSVRLVFNVVGLNEQIVVCRQKQIWAVALPPASLFIMSGLLRKSATRLDELK